MPRLNADMYSDCKSSTVSYSSIVPPTGHIGRNAGCSVVRPGILRFLGIGARTKPKRGILNCLMIRVGNTDNSGCIPPPRHHISSRYRGMPCFLTGHSAFLGMRLFRARFERVADIEKVCLSVRVVLLFALPLGFLPLGCPRSWNEFRNRVYAQVM